MILLLLTVGVAAARYGTGALHTLGVIDIVAACIVLALYALALIAKVSEN